MQARREWDDDASTSIKRESIITGVACSPPAMS